MIEIEISEGNDSKTMLQRLCRTCSNYFEDSMMIPAFDEIQITTELDDGFQLADELIALNVQIEKNDGLPQHLCINCVKHLTQIYTFRHICIKSYNKLKEFLENTKSKSSVLENEEEQINLNHETDNGIKSGVEYDNYITHTNDCMTSDNDEIRLVATFDDGNKDSFKNNLENEEFINYTQKDCNFAQEQNTNAAMDTESDDDSITPQQEKSTVIRKCHSCKKFGYTSRYIRDRKICKSFPLKEEKETLRSSSPFVCFYCNESFKSINTLEDHIKNLHPVEKPYLCLFCNRKFPIPSKRREHIDRWHNGDSIHKCNVCNKIFRRKHMLNKHEQIAHSFGNLYKCEICSKLFEKLIIYKYHVKSHDLSKQLKCRFCDRYFVQKAHLKFHEENHKNADKPLKCDKCNLTFTQKTTYNFHMSSTHGDTLTIKCELCERKFSSQQALNAHKKKHSAPYQCDLCGELLGSKRHKCNGSPNVMKKKNLQIDKKNIKSFKCQLCTKEFTIPTALEKHLKLHDQNRKYTCTICNLSYKKASHLQTHNNRIHSKEISYSCLYCSKVFFDSSTRNHHVKYVHLEQKKECRFCAKEFSIVYLKGHERIHEPHKKDFQCVICGESFVTRSLLRTHYMTHSKTEKEFYVSENVFQNNDENEGDDESLVSDMFNN